MKKRLNDSRLSDHELALGQIVCHRHLGDLGKTVELQHTGRVVQCQAVGVHQSPAACECQRPWADSECFARVIQRLSCKHAHR